MYYGRTYWDGYVCIVSIGKPRGKAACLRLIIEKFILRLTDIDIDIKYGCIFGRVLNPNGLA